MKRWERCNIPLSSPRQRIALAIESGQKLLAGQLPFNGIPHKIGSYEATEGAQEIVRDREIFGLYEILLLNHFQFSHPFGGMGQYLELLTKLSAQYFSGEWIDATVIPDPQRFRRKMSWLDLFRIGILASVVLNDREGLRVIASWVDNEFSRDELDYSQADIDYYVALGKYINHGIMQKSIIDSLMNQRRKRPRFLIEILEAIDKKDGKQFVKVFTEYHKLFDKSECDKDSFLIFKNVNLNGSILWNIAKDRLDEMPIFPEGIMDRIITPQSLGLEK